MPIRLIEQRRRHEVARSSDNNATGEMFRFADKFRRLLKYWGGSHVEAEGGMAGSRGRRIPVPQLRGQLPSCLAPATVALILALAGVARWAEIRAGRALAADIGAALRALANAKIHSNATHPSISTVS